MILLSLGDLKPSNEPAALEALKKFADIPGGCKLVPEHIEKRALFNPERPGVEQVGKRVSLLGIENFPLNFSPSENTTLN